MIGAVLLLALAQTPDAGVPYDAPWKEVRDGGVIVCMTEATSVLVAKGGLGTEVTQKDEEKSLLKTDPAPLTVALWTAGGFTVGVGLTAAIVCALVPGHCGVAK